MHSGGARSIELWIGICWVTMDRAMLLVLESPLQKQGVVGSGFSTLSPSVAVSRQQPVVSG